jgi:hypothetical protein
MLLEGGNFFAAAGERFYHSNIRTPRWVEYFIQTPELHSIHRQFGRASPVHIAMPITLSRRTPFCPHVAV